MYDQDVIELALYAHEEGMKQCEIAKLVGASRSSVGHWIAGNRPHKRGTKRKFASSAKVVPSPKAQENPMGLQPSESEKKLYEPPASGPLAGLEPSQIENLLLRAVLDDLKVRGFDLASISNRSKVELGERLRLATGLPLRLITAFLRISKSSYEYHRARLSSDKYATLREDIRILFEQGDGNWGYRTIWARLRQSGTRVSEKVVRRIMAEEGLRVVYSRHRRRSWSSYKGEISAAPENLVGRDFHADAPNKLWLTDITEFKLPDGRKVYLSPVVDCYDGKPIAWSIGKSPTAELANQSLMDAVLHMQPGSEPIVHSDRGSHYRWPGWIDICEEYSLIRSMSKKGCTPDNSACEGFFGRLKNEFFYYRDWSGVSPEEFAERLDAYLRYYCEERIKKSLGWMSPNDYRRSKGYAV